MRHVPAAPVFLISAVLGAPAAAQQVISARAGLIYYAEGAVYFDGIPARALEGERYPALRNGQVVSTEQGHAEIQLGAGATLWTGRLSKIRLVESRLDDTLLRLEAGSAMIEVRHVPEDNRLRLEIGGAPAELAAAGLYRFEASPPKVRVYAGECLLAGVRIRQNQQAAVSATPEAAPFLRGRPDELHYWAAWRSFRLAEEIRFREGRWDLTGIYTEIRRHPAFDIEFPILPGAARAQYVTASVPGLISFLKGQASLGGPDQPPPGRVPLRLFDHSSIATGPAAYAEIFFGVGVAARLGENAEMRFLDAAPLDSTVLLSAGKATFEVSRAAAHTRVRIAVGETVTELERAGLYEFDAGVGLLRVWGGQARLSAGGRNLILRRNQSITLARQPQLRTLDRDNKDALFEWTRERSLALAASAASFMTQWERGGAFLRHPQFGRIELSPPRGRAPAR